MPSSPALIDIPAHILHAELLRRQEETDERPKCETKGGKGQYNTTLHVFALLLILTLSTAGTSAALPTLQPPIANLHSLFLPNHRQALSLDPRAPPVPLHLTTLWHRRTYSHRFRSSPPHCLRVSHTPMSSSLLEQALSRHAGPRGYDGCLRGCEH